VGGVRRPGTASQNLADGWRRVGVDVEIVGEIALGIEVDRQDVHADPAQHVGQGADERGLAGAALLGEDGDGVGRSGEDGAHREIPCWNAGSNLRHSPRLSSIHT
jgi:hypothetical protein